QNSFDVQLGHLRFPGKSHHTKHILGYLQLTSDLPQEHCPIALLTVMMTARGRQTMPTEVLNRGMFSDFRTARRVHQSILAGPGKRVLIWVGELIPAWVNSDHLTVLGFAAQIGTGVCYALSRFNRFWLMAAILCLALNWFGDSLDGTLARVRENQRPR